MSECGDSFEEIGLMQPGLSGSASISDQESNNLNNSTMSNSTNQMNAAQLKELKFELTGKIRDEIIGNLSELTKLLSGLAVEPDARETMRKANGDLMVALLNLPVKADGRLRCSESLGQSSDDRPNHQPSDRSIEVVFELNSDLRSRIVDTLMTNHNVALLLGADSVENECKLKLIVRNNEMICELVKLKSRTVAISSDSLSNNTLSKGTFRKLSIEKFFKNSICQFTMTNLFANLISIFLGDHRIDQAAKASGSQTISRSVATNEAKNDDELNSSERPDRNQDPALQQQKLVEHPVTGQAASSPTVEEVAILKEELQKLKIRTAGELDDLKQKLAESKRLDVCRNEITFTTTLSAYDYSSDKKSIKEMESEVFHFRGEF